MVMHRYLDIPKHPIREVLNAMTGKPVPRFVKGYDLKSLTDDERDKLQSWAVNAVRPRWATGIGILEAAEQQVREAVSNGNIPPDPNAKPKPEPEPPPNQHYILDARQAVGNCASWWAENSAGYTCELDKAGLYDENSREGSRSTDVHVPEHIARACVVQHVRMDHLRDEMGKRGLSLRNEEAEARDARIRSAHDAEMAQKRKEAAAKSKANR